MSEEVDTEEKSQPGKKGKGLILGVVLGVVAGGGGFYATWSGMIFPADHADPSAEKTHAETKPLDAVAFVPIQPLVVNVGNEGSDRHLRFQAQLEVEPGTEEAVSALLPRVVDALNGYLRAVDATQLEEPSALIRLKAQMLRRVQVLVGEGRVKNLLIMEFVLN